jgi:hypothetical protein
MKHNWICTNKQLPNRKTRYASTFGVPVLGFDLNEVKDSGYYIPHEIVFHFEKSEFETLAINPWRGKTIWIPVSITHWQPLPEAPIKMKLPRRKKYGRNIVK